MESPFLQGDTWRRRGVTGISYSWRDSDQTQEEKISQWEQSAIGIISPGGCWIPQLWALLRFSWTEHWDI